MKQPPAFSLRIPTDIRRWLDEQAKKNLRSMNSEIVKRLDDARQAERATATHA